jgi:hypothetical protein
MHLISIDASPHQLRKLKKGHKIRLRKGEGFNLIVHPTTYNLMSRAFRKNKGVDVKLSKEELDENQKVSEEPELMQQHAEATKEETGEMPSMEGQGIFSKIKRGLKKAMPILKPLAREGLKLAQPKLSEKLANKPVLQKAVNLGMSEASKRLGKGMPRGCGMRGRGRTESSEGHKRSRSESPPVHGLTRKVSQNVMANNAGNQDMTSKAIEARIKNHYPTYDELSEEPFAPFSRGYGLHGSYSKSIVGHGGGMVGYGTPYTHPALMSQPYSANYQMSHFLPPNFQHYNNSMHEPHGNGLYAGRGMPRGCGMYAGSGLFA